MNRKDRNGRNVFEGGFLGLDNIGVFDRSAALPTGGYLEQADGTAWVALFCQNMCELAVELTAQDPAFEDMCTKFTEHFLWIASGMNHTGPAGMWDEEDGFYYDVLRLPDGSAQRLKVRSMVGLLPLCATMRDREVAARPRAACGRGLALAPCAHAGAHGERARHGTRTPWRPRARHPRAGERGAAASNARDGCSTRTSS